MDSGLYIQNNFYKNTNNPENFSTCPQNCPGCLLNKFSYNELWQEKLSHWQNVMYIPLNTIELHPALPDERFFYRKKTLLHVSNVDNQYELGFSKRNIFFPVNTCLLHDETINYYTTHIRVFLKAIPPIPLKYLLIHRNQIVFIIKHRKSEQILKHFENFLPSLPLEKIHGIHLHFNPSTGNRIFQKNVLETIHGSRYTQDENGFYYSALTFTQHQTRMLRVVIEKTINFFDNAKSVLDLYGGTGITTYFFQQTLKEATLIENHPDSVACARLNNPDAEILQGNTSDRMSQLFEKSRKFDAIYLNPPRNGLDDKTLHLILKFNPSKIAYLSCNPHTLKRDMTTFLHHNYQPVSMDIFDFFPFTFHVETLVLLRKIS